ncbi:hypothetical protein INT47_000172 [Mucor saturninus]|uniref:Uncharacterized protein n=1 Tax=Mucor saturninus TaxID=64648 RepID=A0A8H7QDG1_9FUNG|nr:hypothetical protein INT47_000172 [Mucor saturninus]
MLYNNNNSNNRTTRPTAPPEIVATSSVQASVPHAVAQPKNVRSRQSNTQQELVATVEELKKDVAALNQYIYTLTNQPRAYGRAKRGDQTDLCRILRSAYYKCNTNHHLYWDLNTSLDVGNQPVVEKMLAYCKLESNFHYFMDERNENLSEDGKSIVKACIRSMHDHARSEKKKMALSPEDLKDLRKVKKMTARKNRKLENRKNAFALNKVQIMNKYRSTEVDCMNILAKGYMSDEDDGELDEDDEATILVLTPSWRSNKCNDFLKDLDLRHKKSLKKQGEKKKRTRAVRECNLDEEDKSKLPEWARV